MLRGVRVAERFPYIDEEDDAPGSSFDERVANGATVFWLGTLPVDIRTKIADGVMGFDQPGGLGTAASLKMNTARQNLEAMRFGLKGFDNFQDPDGKQIKFETDTAMVEGREYTVASYATLAHFETRQINNIGRKILNSNAVSADERKN